MKTLSYEKDQYQVRATRPLRKKDVARFVVLKHGSRRNYVTTFSTPTGEKGECSCPARTKVCRHQKMLKSFVPKLAAQSPQTTLPFEQAQDDREAKEAAQKAAQEYQQCRKRYAELRAKAKKIEAEMKAVEIKGKTLKKQLEAA